MAFTIRVDAQKNRLYITLSGLFSDEEARVAADAAIEGAAKMRPGFYVVNDISRFRPLTKEGVAQARRAGEFCAQCGMKATVRVTGISPTAHAQFERAAKEGGYVSYVAPSVEDADALLDGHKDG
jgi:hypothetical protein